MARRPANSGTSLSPKLPDVPGVSVRRTRVAARPGTHLRHHRPGDLLRTFTPVATHQLLELLHLPWGDLDELVVGAGDVKPAGVPLHILDSRLLDATAYILGDPTVEAVPTSYGHKFSYRSCRSR